MHGVFRRRPCKFTSRLDCCQVRRARAQLQTIMKTKGGEHMKLLTEEIKSILPALYSQEKVSDPFVYVKYFDPVGSWTWYATEGEEADNEDFLFFGFVVGFDAELGYFTLSQLESAKSLCEGIQALPIERDLYFTPCRLSEVKAQHNREYGTHI